MTQIKVRRGRHGALEYSPVDIGERPTDAELHQIALDAKRAVREAEPRPDATVAFPETAQPKALEAAAPAPSAAPSPPVSPVKTVESLEFQPGARLQCPHCDRDFGEKKGMLSHIRAKHPEKV